MNKIVELFSSKNPNLVLSVDKDIIVLQFNESNAQLLNECNVKKGKKLPSYMGDIVQKVISQNGPEKIEVNVGERVYLVVFSPLPKEEYVIISGFDITNLKKLDKNVPEIQAVLWDLELADVIDIRAVQSLLDDFYELAHIPISIDDLKGNVLVGVGWQDICTKFHRINPETCKLCVESSTTISENVLYGRYKIYKCKNDMWHLATPITMGGQHVGNIISGQFFFEDEPLDFRLFRSKARKYGFNEEEYIAALKKVPRLSRKTVDKGMSFFMKLANMISQLSYGNIKLAQSLTERNALLEALRKSEEKSRNLIETANEGIVVLDDKSTITYANEKMAEMLECTQNEIIGKSVRDFTDENGKIIFEQNMKKRSQGIDETHEFKFINKDGSHLWTLVNSKSLFDKDGRFMGSLSMLTDITRRKEVEARLKETLDNLEERVKEQITELEKAYELLKESEGSLAEAQKMAHIGNWEWEIAIDKANWSEELYCIFGRNPLESAPTYDEYLNYVHPEERDYVSNAFKKAAVDGEDYRIDHKIILANGKERAVHIQSKVIFDENNTPIRIRGTVQDITERKNSEEKIKMLADMVESSNDAIVTRTLDGIITSWNKGAELMYNYSADEIIGKNITLLEPDDHKGEMRQLTEKVKCGEKIKNFETEGLKKYGIRINVSNTLSPVFDSSGKLIAISTISRDISESKKAEKKLLQEKRKAEVANRTKSDFLANMSHELRTPLNSIIGFSDILHEQMYGELNEKQQRHVENISKSGKHLLNLINSILDISKVEAGQIKLDFKDFELANKLNMIRNLLSPIANKKNIKIEIILDKELNTIYADEEKFTQIMYNLVDNAVKFSYENSLVIIEARRKGDMVEIMVIDHGIGIRTKDQHKLFKPFSQIDSFSSKKSQGTGLGLSLVKQIVHLHGGYIWFRSNLGEGSTFAFAIPTKNNCT